MKLIHNDKVSLAWAILVELIVHGIFALGAFLMGGFLGDIALSHILGPLGEKIGAYGLAIFVFCAAFQAFVLGEYMKEHVTSYEAELARQGKRDGSYMSSWRETRYLVGAIELCSLAFRCIVVAQQGDYGQLIATLIFGVVALRYAYTQAKVIHASVNRPVAYDFGQMQQQMGRDLVKDVIGTSEYMTAEEKYNFLEGDVRGVTTAQARRPKGWFAGIRGRRQAEREQAQERERAQQEEYNRSKEFTDRFIPTYNPFQSAQRTSQADPLSQNGRDRLN